MFFYPHPKYKFKQDYTAKFCSNFLENPCTKYQDLAFKKGDVFEATSKINPDPLLVYGLAKMSSFSVPINVLEKVSDETPVTEMFPEISTKNIIAQNKILEEIEEKTIKKMFLVPTVIILALVWIYGLKKL